MPDPQLQAVFGKPAKEVVEYFDRKRQQPSEGWETVSAAEQQRAFTVAQSAGFNILGDIQDALKRARDEGWSVSQFQDHLEPLLRAKGWWGKAIDPETGEILKMYPGTHNPVVYGSASRLRLIYDTNMATSYGAGRRERQMAVKGAFPYLRYIAVMDGRTRPAHRALHGQVWPVDHPIWDSIYPPNGYRCRCMTQSLTGDDVPPGTLNEGGDGIEKYVPVNAARDMVKLRGWRTADGREFYPDAGFDVAPGNSASHLEHLARSLERLPEAARIPAASVLTKSQAFSLWRENPQGNFPIAVASQKDANRIGQKEGSRIVNLSPDTMAKQDRVHKELTNAEYLLVQKSMSLGKVIQEGAHNLIYVYEEGDQVAIVKATKTGQALFLTSMRRLSSRGDSRNREILRLLEKGAGGGAPQPSKNEGNPTWRSD